MMEIHVVPNEIGPFVRRVVFDTTMEFGFYYEAKMKLPFAEEERYVRVWLPPTYDFVHPKKHPVMYMSDGQNLVDKFLTKYGDWHLDRVMDKLRKRGYDEAILVGIDSHPDPLQRSNELNPPYPIRRKYVKRGGPTAPIGNLFLDYIARELKPLIDSLFSTNPSREATGIGGSSMGGIMAFYGFLRYGATFGFSLAFSVPFFFYSKRDLRRILKIYRPDPAQSSKIFFFVGGKDFEGDFTKGVFYMNRLLQKKYRFGPDRLRMVYDPDAIHHEEWWSTYAFDALEFWFRGLK